MLFSFPICYQAKLKGEPIIGENDLYIISEWLEPRNPSKDRGPKPAILADGPPKKPSKSSKELPKVDLEFKKEWSVFQTPDNPSNIQIHEASQTISAGTIYKIVERFKNSLFYLTLSG